MINKWNYLRAMCIASNSPWGILSGNGSTDLYLPAGVDLVSLSYVLRRYGVVACFLATLVLVIMLMVIHDPKAVSERKRDIEHKLVTVAVLMSLVTIFSAVKSFFDALLL